jgi:predicted AlkP superfamily phosphohydrolase/phosphomutase/tetratricopeptide (TPR) repeat protein
MNRVLLIGWDAADWKVIRPLLEAGQMPNLARLMAEGVHGNLATIYPALSPMLWTSIATGKRAYKHGIHGFAEPLPDGSGVRAITLLSRKTKALWNILNQSGWRSLVVGWWPSHPAEPLNGVMVSNHFQTPVGRPGEMPPPPSGSVHPQELAATLAELRVNPMELDGDFLRLFVPDYQKVDQARDKRLHTLGKIIAETITVHAVATELLTTQSWDFAACYYAGIDHFGHAFMRYHPPRLPWVTEGDFAIYQHVIANAYRYHDAMLGTLLSFCDANTNIILLSDHGFHPDHLRPGYIPAEPAGPAVEHRHYGIICCKGPQFRIDEKLYGAGLLDVCPTILALFGLPPGKDMDGKVLVTAFKEQPVIDPIESWDQVDGNSGTHAPGTRMDAVASAEAFKQLVELGYVAPPAADSRRAVDEAVRELKYNLARSYREANSCGEAAALAEELWATWPSEHRFGILLVDCLAELGHLEKRRTVIEELARRIEQYQSEAAAQLAQKATSPKALENDPSPAPVVPQPEDLEPDPQKARSRFEDRQLQELANGRPLLIEWLLVSQALFEKRPDEARRCLEKLTQSGAPLDALNQGLASAFAELGEPEAARSLLEQFLQSDPENAVVHSQLAAIHFKAGRFDETIASASESLSLLYFQPGIHTLLGRALMESKRFAEAEKEFQVAIAQSPRNLVANEWLGRLYREHLGRPEEAFAYEGRALSLRNEHALRSRATVSVPSITHDPAKEATMDDLMVSFVEPQKFGPEIESSRIITVVSGLPRSGTSMMMQLLVAAGREALTDSKRAADEDNPLGYLEFEKTLGLAKDVSWIPQARGKVIKIVAQLLPFLPANEHYQIIFMQRKLGEVIASQKTMLERGGRRGAELNEMELRKVYIEQLHRVSTQLVRRTEIRTLAVDYSELLREPEKGVGRIAAFLGEPFAFEKAVGTIHPELQRQKA